MLLLSHYIIISDHIFITYIKTNKVFRNNNEYIPASGYNSQVTMFECINLYFVICILIKLHAYYEFREYILIVAVTINFYTYLHSQSYFGWTADVFSGL